MKIFTKKIGERFGILKSFPDLHPIINNKSKIAMTIQFFVRSIFLSNFALIEDGNHNNQISLSMVMDGPLGLFETIEAIADEFCKSQNWNPDSPVTDYNEFEIFETTSDNCVALMEAPSTDDAIVTKPYDAILIPVEKKSES